MDIKSQFKSIYIHEDIGVAEVTELNHQVQKARENTSNI